ncbi:hypothetical protein BV882_19685 [Streptomyces sp. 46]|nr:hypothetical protein BV882_19685 [Streptomyces sp. 46]
MWLRSGSPVPGALVLKDADGRTRRFRRHGARATWWDGPQPAVHLHLVEAGASDRFVVLSRQVEALTREVTFRRPPKWTGRGCRPLNRPPVPGCSTCTT